MKPLPRYKQYMAERSTTNYENYIKALRSVGRAVEVDHVVFDGESVFRRRFVCDTRTCSPTTNPETKLPWRESGAKSCCADLVVDLSPIEIQALERHWHAIRDYLATKDRFFEGKTSKDCLVLSSDFEVSLRKRANRCIFAIRDPEWGIRCGIHAACLEKGIPLREAKPVVCDTFPLIIMDLEGGRFYVGAHDSDIEGLAGLGDDPITAFPCLADSRKGKPMYVEMESVLRSYFGDEHYEKTAAAAEEYLTLPRPPKMKLP
jgi:hypothetical protein